MKYGFDAGAKRAIVHIDSSDTYENRLLQWEALFKDQRWKAGYVIIISTTGPYVTQVQEPSGLWAIWIENQGSPNDLYEIKVKAIEALCSKTD